MVRKWTESELAEELSKLVVICDSKEQDRHCEEWYKKNNIPHKRRSLETGDYSAMLGELTLEHDIAVERKGNLDEICMNLTSDRDRFEREFMRAKARGIKMFLLIENASWEKIFLGDYRSEVSSKSLVASMLSWQVRYNVTIIFCNPSTSAKLIYGILHYYAREKLLYG